MPNIVIFLLFTLTASITHSQEKFGVRGSAPFETTLAGVKYPEYGSILLRCDSGSCNLQKVTFLCDRNNADFGQASVTADRIRIVRKPSKDSPYLELDIDDFGTDYRCAFQLRQGTKNSDKTFYINSYTCDYASTWHGNKKKVEQSVDKLDLKRRCKQIVLERSQW